MPFGPLDLGLPPGTEITAVALTPGDHLNLVPGDNWIIDPPAAWVAAQGQARLDQIAAFQAGGYAVQPNLLYRPRGLGSFNPKLNRAPPAAALSVGLRRTSAPAMPQVPVYLDAASNGRFVSYPWSFNGQSGPGYWYSTMTIAALLHASDGATWLASLRSEVGGMRSAACLGVGQNFNLRLSLTPFGHIDGEPPVTGYVYSSDGAVEFIHPTQGTAGQIDLAAIPIDLGSSPTTFAGGIGDLFTITESIPGEPSYSPSFFLDGLAILDQKNHGRTLLIGVLVNQAPSYFELRDYPSHTVTDIRKGWTETAWLRAVIEVVISDNGQGGWSATATVLHTPATLESASTLWTVVTSDDLNFPQPLTYTTTTGTAREAPMLPCIGGNCSLVSIRGEHLVRRALTAYYRGDGTLAVRYSDYRADSLQAISGTVFTYHQAERLDLVEAGVVLSSLDSVADGGDTRLETAGNVHLHWRMKFHDQANTAFTGQTWQGGGEYHYNGNSGAYAGSDWTPPIPYPISYPLNRILALAAISYSGHRWYTTHQGGQIYHLWRLGAIAWEGLANTPESPELVRSTHVLRLAGGETLHADLPLFATLEKTILPPNPNVSVEQWRANLVRLDHAAAVTPFGTLPAASYTYAQPPLLKDYINYTDNAAIDVYPWLDIAHARYNRATQTHLLWLKS